MKKTLNVVVSASALLALSLLAGLLVLHRGILLAEGNASASGRQSPPRSNVSLTLPGKWTAVTRAFKRAHLKPLTPDRPAWAVQYHSDNAVVFVAHFAPHLVVVPKPATVPGVIRTTVSGQPVTELRQRGLSSIGLIYANYLYWQTADGTTLVFTLTSTLDGKRRCDEVFKSVVLHPPGRR